MLSEIFSIIAPVLVCAAIGFVWARSGRPYDTALVTTLVTNIGTPCLVFATLATVDTGLAAYGEMAIAGLVTVLIFGAVGWVALKAAGLSQRAYLASQMFANVGNMGLPLCLLAFGETGLAFAIAYLAVNVVLLFTIGVALPSGATRPGHLLKLPIIYAVTASLAAIAIEVPVPRWITNTTDILGNLTIPLMLITLGVSLADMKIDSLKRSLWLSVLRLVMGFAVGWATAEVMGFDGVARGVLIIQCAMPIAVFNYLFAARYDREPAEVAGTVVISTVLSFLSLPALLWFVL